MYQLLTMYFMRRYKYGTYSTKISGLSKYRAMTLLTAIAELFRYQIVGSIMVLTCLPDHDRIKIVRELYKYDIPVSFSCDPTSLEEVKDYKLQGVLYIPSPKVLLENLDRKYFSNLYKWIILHDSLPDIAQRARYDADILFVKAPSKTNGTFTSEEDDIYIYDVYSHPRDGATVALWGKRTVQAGLQVMYNGDRLSRRRNLRKYPLKIATPVGSYTKESYNGTLLDYLMDQSITERDSAVRIGYYVANIIVEALNATEVMIPTKLWGSDIHNDSMISELKYGKSDLSGAILRIMETRFDKLDYFMPIWPFQVGFTYLGERESNSNMFLEPFTVHVWLCCLSIFLILAIAQRITAKSSMEKEGAYIAALATYLQQDASAVPQGISGRWTFVVLSISAMLIHAYYTSAIVSALMSAGRNGPDSLTSLGDSRYAIASEDYEYMRFLMFDVKTNQEDLEYLKKKKMTSEFYQDIQKAVPLIGAGNTAFHTEYNQLYPLLKTFTDDQLCKLQYVDTVPEILTWLSTTKRGQWTNTFKIISNWLLETGIGKRFVTRLRFKPPPCRAALLAERVNINDIAPVLIFTFAGVLASLILLGVEILVFKFKVKRSDVLTSDLVENTEDDDD